jgi:hypothetical protein
MGADDGSTLTPPGVRACSSVSVYRPAAIQPIRLTPDDLSLRPRRFASSGLKGLLTMSFAWGMPQETVGQSPIMHHTRIFIPAAYMGAVFSLMSDDITQSNMPLHCGKLKGAGPARYKKVKGDPDGLTDDPFTFEISAGGRRPFLYRHSTKHTRVVESDILDVTFDHFPFCMCLNPPSVSGPAAFTISPYLNQLGVAHGTYLGKPVRYLGGNDRFFVGSTLAGIGSKLLLIAGYFSGELADGGHHYGCVMAARRDSGKGETRSIAFYCKEGALGSGGERGTEIVTSQDVHGEVWWKQLEWVPKPVIAKATYRFAGKVIEMTPKWGFSVGSACDGPAKKPAVASNFSGMWQEVGSSSDFTLSFLLGESHATPDMVSYDLPTVF